MNQQREGYSFEEIGDCNFCGRSTESNTILGRRLNKRGGFRPQKQTGVSVSVIRCTKCGLVYSDPKPLPMSIEQHYNVDPYTYWPEAYFQYDQDYFRDEIETAKRLLNNFTDGAKALDVGCGIGKAMLSLEKAGFEAFGIEPSQRFIDCAVDKMGMAREKMSCASVETATFEPNSFDFITFGAVLEHLSDPKGAICSSLEWLKPGGLIQIEVPSADWLLPKLINWGYRLQGTTFVTNLSPMHVPYHFYEFTRESFEILADTCGAEIAHHEYFVCSILNMPKFLHPFLKRIMEKNNSGMQLSIWLRKK